MKMILLFLISTSVLAFPTKPISEFTYPHFCTDKDQDFREFRYNQIAICHRRVNNSMRNKVYELYNIPVHERKNYTIDHLVPLSLGGSNKIQNLWPQHNKINTARIEFRLYMSVRNNEIGIQEAYSRLLEEKYFK